MLDELFPRLEAALTARAGAGQADVWAQTRSRWARELAGDLPLQEQAVATLMAKLDAALSPADTVDGIRIAIAGLRSEAARFTPAVEATIDANEGSPHVVYLLSDSSGRLLYVGITDRGPRRLVEHAKTKPWWPQVAAVHFERCSSRDHAATREAHLIRTLRPRFNVVHNRERIAS